MALAAPAGPPPTINTSVFIVDTFNLPLTTFPRKPFMRYGFTVSVASALVAVPALLLTTTLNRDYSSSRVVGGSVLGTGSPPIPTPFFLHW